MPPFSIANVVLFAKIGSLHGVGLLQGQSSRKTTEARRIKPCFGKCIFSDATARKFQQKKFYFWAISLFRGQCSNGRNAQRNTLADERRCFARQTAGVFFTRKPLETCLRKGDAGLHGIDASREGSDARPEGSDARREKVTQGEKSWSETRRKWREPKKETREQNEVERDQKEVTRKRNVRTRDHVETKRIQGGHSIP